MDELHNELHRHYELLLGVKSPWEVNGVKLDMAGRRLEIRLEWAMGNTVACPECGKQCTVLEVIEGCDQATAEALWPEMRR